MRIENEKELETKLLDLLQQVITAQFAQAVFATCKDLIKASYETGFESGYQKGLVDATKKSSDEERIQL